MKLLQKLPSQTQQPTRSPGTTQPTPLRLHVHLERHLRGLVHGRLFAVGLSISVSISLSKKTRKNKEGERSKERKNIPPPQNYSSPPKADPPEPSPSQ